MGTIAAMKNNHYWLSIVIIGRNEERHLPVLFSSLPVDEHIEWIYIDSGSEDNSAALAQKLGAKVVVVDKNSVYAPGTGRYIGTKEAAGYWILYLDGDMVLRKEFLAFLERLKDEDDLPQGTVGFVGRTCNKYLDNNGSLLAERDFITLSPREMGAVDDWGKPASYHGGAVLYRRDVVLAVGNWNPAVYQLEEIDLYSRIWSQGGFVRAVDLPMAYHYTPYLSTWERMKLNFLPQWQGKKLYGAGQVVAARFKEGGLIAFMRLYPYPFIIFSGLFLSPLLYLLWPLLPLYVNLAIIVWLGLTKKWYYYLVYLGNLLQIFRGLCHYKPFEPRYKNL